MATLKKKKVIKTTDASKKVVPTTTKAVKSTKVDKKELEEKNLKNTITKAVVSNREVKYIYPDDMAGDQLKMKKHRAKLRKQNEKALAEIADIKKIKGDPSKEEKAYAKFRKENYLVP